jgi:sensor c-di-GMP phosphodiesterase-like protein
MQVAAKTRLSISAMTIMGVMLGALGGFWLSRAALLHTAQTELTAYARELSRNADILNQEVNAIFPQMQTAPALICSDHDIAALKTQTFRNVHVKDVGRTHEGKLYCSAFLGRLKQPYIEGPPTLVMENGANVYTHVAVLMDSRGREEATILEASDVDVVLNSNAFLTWYRPNVTYMVVAFNRATGQVAQIAGQTLKIKPSWVLTHTVAVDEGVIYRKACSKNFSVCVVTAEQVSDVWKAAHITQLVYSVMGGFAGLSFSLLIVLLYLRARRLQNQLLRAVRQDSPSLQLVYQPIMSVASGRCTGAEALLRWRDQDGVSIPPDVFIPLAERCGFIHELTALVIRRATLELGDLLRDHHEFTLSVNIAASDLGDERLFDLLQTSVSQAGIAPARLALELTERSTGDVAVLGAAIQRLKRSGYRVYLDDFGTGFSSLSYIDKLRVDTIKIDRAFTQTIGTDAMFAPLLAQMVEMANSLRMETVVEGVETSAQRDYLAAVDQNLRAQGWFFSRPLTAEALRSFQAHNEAEQLAYMLALPALEVQPV